MHHVIWSCQDTNKGIIAKTKDDINSPTDAQVLPWRSFAVRTVLDAHNKPGYVGVGGLEAVLLKIPELAALLIAEPPFPIPEIRPSK